MPIKIKPPVQQINNHCSPFKKSVSYTSNVQDFIDEWEKKNKERIEKPKNKYWFIFDWIFIAAIGIYVIVFVVWLCLT